MEIGVLGVWWVLPSSAAAAAVDTAESPFASCLAMPSRSWQWRCPLATHPASVALVLVLTQGTHFMRL